MAIEKQECYNEDKLLRRDVFIKTETDGAENGRTRKAFSASINNGVKGIKNQ